MMFMIEVGLERLGAWSRQLLRACKAGSVRLSRCSSVAVALRRCWRLPSVTRTRTHLSIFSHSSPAWTAWICFVSSAQLGLSNSTSCSPSCVQHNKAAQSASSPPIHTRRAVAYLCLHFRLPRPLHHNVANLHQYSSPAIAVSSALTPIVYPTTL